MTAITNQNLSRITRMDQEPLAPMQVERTSNIARSLARISAITTIALIGVTLIGLSSSSGNKRNLALVGGSLTLMGAAYTYLLYATSYETRNLEETVRRLTAQGNNLIEQNMRSGITSQPHTIINIPGED